MDISNRIMRDWVVFITVIEVRSFTTAARKLRCSIASVSKSVARLEETLGVVLLSRNAHKMDVTAAGHVTYNGAKEIHRAWQELFTEISNVDDGIKGKMRFSAPSVLCECAAGQWVFDYMRRNPGAKVRLLSRDRTELTVASPEFDDLVLKSGMTDSPDLVHQSIGHVRFGLYASPGYLRTHPEIHTPDDLRRHWIMKVDHPFLRCPLSLTKGEETSELTVTDTTTLVSNNIPALLSMTLSGAGVCLALPDWMAAPHVQSGALAPVLPDWQLPEMPVWLVWRHREHYSHLFEDFRHYIAGRWEALSADASSGTEPGSEYQGIMMHTGRGGEGPFRIHNME